VPPGSQLRIRGIIPTCGVVWDRRFLGVIPVSQSCDPVEQAELFAPGFEPCDYSVRSEVLARGGSFCHLDPMNARLSIDPRVCHGQACIRGTRIPVHQIVRMFAHGDSIDTLLDAFGSITREDVLACLDYAASLAEEQVTPLDDVALAP
jgi:uncharacterized protein (DUF433 family)